MGRNRLVKTPGRGVAARSDGPACRPWLCAHLSQHHPCNAEPLWGGSVAGDHWSPDGKCIRRKLSDAAAVWRDCKPYHDRALPLLSAGDSDSDGPYARNAAKRDRTGTIKQRQLNAAAVSAQHDGSGCGSALWETACKRRCFNKIRIWEEK